MSDAKLKVVHEILANIKKAVENVELMVQEIDQGHRDISDSEMEKLETMLSSGARKGELGTIIEGVFDGYQMIGPDGNKYSIPANYASKSKLVEGDLLKLTIAPDGAFIFKQIKPIDRERLKGKLVKDKETGEFRVLVGRKLFKVLLASVTYYKGDVGDSVTILVPKGGQSAWAAVDNIILGDDDDDGDSEDDLFADD